MTCVSIGSNKDKFYIFPEIYNDVNATDEYNNMVNALNHGITSPPYCMSFPIGTFELTGDDMTALLTWFRTRNIEPTYTASYYTALLSSGGSFEINPLCSKMGWELNFSFDKDSDAVLFKTTFG